MATRFFLSRQQVSDDNGAPLSGATLDFYVTGTSTRKDTFSDAALTTANANPVVADSAGRFGDIFLAAGDYKARLSCSDGTVIWTTDPVEGSNNVAAASANAKNLLVNGAFSVKQRASATAADDQYCFDNWYVLTNTGSVTVAQQLVQEDFQPNNLRMTQPDASAKRFGIAQIVEAVNCRHLRNSAVVLSGRVRFSLAAPVRYAVLAWTGAADSVTSDVVADWASASYTAGGFFISTTLTVVAVGSVTPAAGLWTDLPEITGTMPSTGNNLIVMFWTQNTTAQNATLDLGVLQLEAGEAASAFERRPYTEEVTLCRRYVRMIGAGVTGWANAADQATFGVAYDPPMRAQPSITFLASSWTIVRASGNSLFPATLAVVDSAGFANGSRITFSHGGTLTVGEQWTSLADNVLAASAEL